MIDQFEERYVRPKPGRTLIVGSKVYPGRQDRRKLYPEAIGVDMQGGEGVDVVGNLEDGLYLGAFSHIDCVSVLEHSRRPWLVGETIEALLEIGGTLFVSAPFVHRLHGYPSDYWRFSAHGVKALFGQIEWLAEAYISDKISHEAKQPQTVKVDGYPYHARTGVCLFGRKR